MAISKEEAIRVSKHYKPDETHEVIYWHVKRGGKNAGAKTYTIGSTTYGVAVSRKVTFGKAYSPKTSRGPSFKKVDGFVYEKVGCPETCILRVNGISTSKPTILVFDVTSEKVITDKDIISKVIAELGEPTNFTEMQNIKLDNLLSIK